MRSDNRSTQQSIADPLCTKAQTATYNHMSVATLDILIAENKVRTVRRGKFVLIPREEVIRLSKTSFDRIWPEKVNGKTTRHRRST